MATFDTIIKNGMIIDGTRLPRYHADIGIKNGKIAKIGRLQSGSATRVLDATARPAELEAFRHDRKG